MCQEQFSVIKDKLTEAYLLIEKTAPLMKHHLKLIESESDEIVKNLSSYDDLQDLPIFGENVIVSADSREVVRHSNAHINVLDGLQELIDIFDIIIKKLDDCYLEFYRDDSEDLTKAPYKLSLMKSNILALRNIAYRVANVRSTYYEGLRVEYNQIMNGVRQEVVEMQALLGAIALTEL